MHTLYDFITHIKGVEYIVYVEKPGAEEPTERFLQFDASYQLSFLGGPMVDVYGNVVGMVRGTMGGKHAGKLGTRRTTAKRSSLSKRLRARAPTALTSR